MATQLLSITERGAFVIKKAKHHHYHVKRGIIQEAKRTLEDLNIPMWQAEYPDPETMKEDILAGRAFIFTLDEEVVGTFTLMLGRDPVYEKLDVGEWLTDKPYSTIRRLAVAKAKRGRNITGTILAKAGALSLFDGYPSLRVDTHPDNSAMRRALEKNGFQYCGEIHTMGVNWVAYERDFEQEPERMVKAKAEDLPAIMAIIQDAKDNLKRMGVDQWQQGYPDEAVIRNDIQNSNSYLYYEQGQLVGTFALFLEDDPTYAHIENGEWLTKEEPYAVIHRIAVAKEALGTGVMGRLIERVGDICYAKGFTSVRIDTHPDNKSMQRALGKAAYEYCGHIFLEDGDLRLAYEKLLP